MRSFFRFGFAAILAIALTGGAQARTVTMQACSVANVTTATGCQTILGNNDNLAGMNAGTGVFDTTDWLLADKSDQAAPLIPGINLTQLGGLLTGTWSVGSFGGHTKAALVVKGGSVGWVAYFLDLTRLSGSWSTADLLNRGGNQPGLSHLSLYVADRVAPPPPTPVPLPAAGLLLLAAVGVMAALGRRRT